MGNTVISEYDALINYTVCGYTVCNQRAQINACTCRHKCTCTCQISVHVDTHMYMYMYMSNQCTPVLAYLYSTLQNLMPAHLPIADVRMEALCIHSMSIDASQDTEEPMCVCNHSLLASKNTPFVGAASIVASHVYVRSCSAVLQHN